MKRELRLYNVLFPVWMLFLVPQVWLILLPGNFLIDSLVLLIALAAMRYTPKRQVWKASILWIWIFGFVSDLAGALVSYGLVILGCTLAPDWDWFRIPGGQLVVLPGIALAGVLIFFLNRRFSFRRTELPPEIVRKLSLILAVCTAPYTMLFPWEWLYQ